MEEFRDLASASIAESRPSDQGQYMVNGVVEEQKQNQAQYQLQPHDVKIQAETDLMEEIINDRAQNIKDMADIMGDINQIASDIAIETKLQGEKLENLDQHMVEADTNAE